MVLQTLGDLRPSEKHHISLTHTEWSGSTVDTLLLTGSSYPNPFGLGPPGAKQTLCKEERELRRILTEEGAILQEKRVLVGSPTSEDAAAKQIRSQVDGTEL